jgi:ATP-dependent Clp protease, protease subunit
MTVKKKSRKQSDQFHEYHGEEHPVIGMGSIEDNSRAVFLVGDIDEELIRETTERIIHLSEKNPKKPIILIINTYGGGVDDTFMLYDLIKYIPTPVHTVGLGKIMSAGCLLLAAGTKGKRKIGKNARVMYHCGWDYMGGNIFEMRANLEAFEKQEKQYDARFAEETGMTVDEVEKLYDKNGPTVDKYLSAEDAVRLGIADELI